mgnify:FL=1
MKEAFGDKYYKGNKSAGYGQKDPGWEASKAYHKKRRKQKATGEFGLEKADNTSGPAPKMSPAARQKQLDMMRKRKKRDDAASKKK